MDRVRVAAASPADADLQLWPRVAPLGDSNLHEPPHAVLVDRKRVRLREHVLGPAKPNPLRAVLEKTEFGNLSKR